MNNAEIEEVTDLWRLYENGKLINQYEMMYKEGEENYNYYNGRQWEGLQKPPHSAEPVILNIIKPIIKYKVNTITQNNYQIVFNPNSYSTLDELEELRMTTKAITQFINKQWEKSQSGKKVRNIVKTSAINSEGIIHWYSEDNMINSEEIDKNNVCYGNENEQDIQRQPYIIVTMREPVSEVKKRARKYRDEGRNNLTEEEIEEIVSDKDTSEQQGKRHMMTEAVPMCLVLRKYERNEDGEVCVSEATKKINLYKDENTKKKLYPIAHFVWEEEKGYARGISEVRGLKDNQIEINKTATRRAISIKMGAYPKLVYDGERIVNREALNKVGSAIELEGVRADDVGKIINYLNPAVISPDAYNFQQDLITMTRDLAGASDSVTGQVDPTRVSGKAVLAIQQASQKPLTEQSENFKYFLEDCANIIFEIMKVDFDNIVIYERKDTVNEIGQTETLETPRTLSRSELNRINMSMKIDITPSSAFDRYAQEMSLENLLLNQMITFDEYVEALPDSSTMPKSILESIIKRRKEARNQITAMQQKINQTNSLIRQTLIENGADVDGGIENGMQAMQQPSGNENEQDNTR